MDMLNRAAENLRSEGWDEEAAAVREAADEIERLREALKQVADFDLYGDYSNAYKMPEIARAALKEGE